MDTAANLKPRSTWRAYQTASMYLRCRLCWQLALAVFLCIVAIEAVILVPSVRSFERDLLGRLEATSISALAAVVEIHGAAETGADLAQFEAAFARATPIRGGILLGGNGEPVAAFGEAPASRHDVSVTSESRLNRFLTGRSRRENGTRYDVFWPRARTGLTGDVIMRLDASTIGPELTAFVLRIAALVLIISVFVSGGAMIVLGRTILAPMLQIRNAVVTARDDPAQADSYVLDYRRRNEIGELVAALNRLLERISRTHREELAMLTAMVNETNVAITACDDAGRPIYVNGAALALCGCGSLDEMRAQRQPLFELTDRDSAPIGLVALLEAGSYAGEATLLKAAGRPIPSYVNAGILTDGEDKPLRYYATIADISDVRDAQVRLHQRNVELAAAERTKSRFLASMSHELRTPLNAIIGFSELLGDEIVGTEVRHRMYIEDIRKSGLHLLEIINDVLDMAKIESGTMTVNFSEVCVADIVDDAIRMVSQQLGEKRLSIAVNIGKRVPDMHADELKLRQILLNLLTNAIKFTPTGGAIAVSAAPAFGENGAECIEIVVSDTGVGIAAGELQKILEPFHQGSQADYQQQNGAGLGLALCKALVDAHGGEFSIDSVVGEGTTATLRLPVRQAMENAA